MDWITLISIIASVLSGGLLTYFINPKAAWKKPVLENRSQEVQNESTAISTMQDAIDEIRKSNDHFQAVNDTQEATIESLRSELMKTQKDLSICNTYVCSHLGCGHRCPPRAAAEKWLAELKEGNAAVDYEPLTCERIQQTRDFHGDD